LISFPGPLKVRMVLLCSLLSRIIECPVLPGVIEPRNFIFSFFSILRTSSPSLSFPILQMHPVLNPNLENATAVFVAPPPMSDFKLWTRIFEPAWYANEFVFLLNSVSTNVSITALPKVTISNFILFVKISV